MMPFMMPPGMMLYGEPPRFVPSGKVVAPPQQGRFNPVQHAAKQPEKRDQGLTGVGLYFKMDSLGRYYVEMVLSKSSAEATGVVAKGDILEVVDEKSTQGVSLPQLRDMILGKAGSYVNLTFLREKDGESFRYDIELMRGDPNTLLKKEENEIDIMGSQKSGSPARASAPNIQAPPQQGLEEISKLLSAQAEREMYKKKYLAEQRMHLEAERELGQQREELFALKRMVAQLQAKEANGAINNFPLDADRALQAGFVPKEDLASSMERCKALERELADARRGLPAAHDGAVSRRDYEILERKNAELEEEVRRQMSIVQSHRGGPGNDQIQRMCVMALPAAVSALHSLSEETGHASSATWALVRAEDYVAHLASSRYPLSIPGLVTSISEAADATAQQETVDVQDACLAMSVISWDPEGRNMLLSDSRCVPALLSIMAQSSGKLAGSLGDNAFAALHIPAQVICSRLAAMSLGNFSLDEGGRLSIVKEANAMHVLLQAIAGQDEDTASFALLCAGNLFMISEARQRLLVIGGAVECIFSRLSSRDIMTVRFAAGAVRNFAADDLCREAITKVKGSIALLQDLSRHQNPRIRDHAEHALHNLRMIRGSTRGGEASSGPATATIFLQNTPFMGSHEASGLGRTGDRPAIETIGVNLLGMA